MKYDAIIIGFGKGGKTLAGTLAKQGKQVALVEKSDQMYGGTCINVGCIPSKSLVKSALKSKAHATLSFEQKADIYKKAIKEKQDLTTMLRGKNFSKLDILENVTIYHGEASFLTNTEILVKTDTNTLTLEGTDIFINTGATPVIPNITGLANNPYVYTSESLMNLDVLPKHLVIIGGGYIGLEFSSIYANFGSKVTILQDSEVFLPREDEDISTEIRKVLEENQITIETSASISRISPEDSYATVHYTKGGHDYILPADAVLVATGRRPNTDSLNASAAGVALTSRGAIQVDEHLKSTANNIWAMGDVAGGLQFTYVSLDDYRIVLSGLNGATPRSTATRKNVPYSVFITPSFSRVGLNEKESLAAGYNIKIAKMPASAIPKAQVLKQTHGLLKAIIDVDTNKILGAMLFCEESYEMINVIKLAMDMDADYTVLRDAIYTHPTMTEALNDLFSLI